MTETKTILRQTELLRGPKVVQVKLMKEILDHNGNVIFSQPHRFTIDESTDLDAQVAAVNAHLEEMGYPHISDEAKDAISADVRSVRGVNE